MTLPRRAVLLWACLGAWACESGPLDPNTPVSVALVAGDNVNDTIEAIPAPRLSAVIRDVDGTPAANVPVRFVATNMSVAATAGSVWLAALADTTDAAGVASVALRLGRSAGAGSIEVRALAGGTTAHYIVRAGAPSRIAITPADTTLSLGAAYTYQAIVTDRLGHPLATVATFESSAAVQVDPAGRAIARATGVAWVRAKATAGARELVDSARVRVNPGGTVVWSRRGGGGLMIGDLRSGDHRRLTTLGMGATSWLPGENRLVAAFAGNLYLVDLDGRTEPILVPGLIDQDWPEVALDAAGDPWIYFQARARTAPNAVRHIYRIRPNATGLVDLTPTTNAVQPTPSPDGREVAYSTQGSFIQILNLGSGLARELLVGPGLGPRWSPDGQWIAFVRPDRNELMVVRPDGTGLRRLGPRGNYPGISWSADSRWILGAEQSGVMTEVETGAMTFFPWGEFTSAQWPSWRR